MWYGFWSRGIIGPFFFKIEQEEAATVNGNRYRTMLNEILFTKIEDEDIGNNQPPTLYMLKFFLDR